MAITVKLYGRLRELAPRLDSTSGTIGIVEVEREGEGTVVETILDRLQLDGDSVGHVFVNGSYASLQKSVTGEDRVAIFPEDMGLLYHWYFEKDE